MGRPRKEVVDIPVTVKKGRGRPRKVDVAVDEYFKLPKEEQAFLPLANMPVVAKPDSSIFPVYMGPAQVEEKIHAKFGSPSALSRTENCPAWVAYGKDVKEPETSPYAAEGNVFHSYMETWIPRVLEGEKIKKINDPQYPEMGQHVVDTLHKVKENWEKFNTAHTQTAYHVELRVKVSDDSFGTADLVFTGKNNKTKLTDIIVSDWKFGMGVRVEAEENRQGIAYLIGAIKTLGFKFDEIGKAGIIIAQVRLDDGWSVYVVPSKELPVWDKKFISWVAKAKDIYTGKLPIDGNLKAGTHCKFCKCLDMPCKEVKKTRIDELQLSAEELPVLQELPLDQQVKLFLLKSQIEDFLDANAKSLKTKAEMGLVIPGLKLIQTNGRRKWGDVEGAGEFLEGMGMDPWKKSLVGIGDAEKFLGKHKKDIDKFVVLGEGKTELVRDSDKRKELQNIKNLQSQIEELE